MSAVIGGKVKSTVKDMSGPMITVGRLYKGSSAQEATDFMNALGSFSWSEWMLNVLEGKDLLTPDNLLDFFNREDAKPPQKQAAAQYGKSIAIYLRGHGNTENIKDVKEEKSGGLALLENRAVAPKVSGGGALTKREAMSIDEVHSFAVKYFAWAMSIKQARAEAEERKKAWAKRLADDAHTARITNFLGIAASQPLEAV